MKGLMRYLQDEWNDKKSGEFKDSDLWKLVPSGDDVPVQPSGNDDDCGVFICMFADFISLNRPLTFNQEHITQCRERIALSIMKGIAID